MKKYIFGMISGIFLTITVGVIATVLYSAKDISFEPSNSTWQVNNVEDAIKDIKNTHMSGKDSIINSLNSIGITPTSDSYTDINNSIKSISPMKLGNVIYSNSRGDLLTSRTTSVTLNKGKYIVVADFVFAYADTATHNENSKTDSSFSTIQCSKCSIRQLDTEKIYISSSAIRGTMYPYAWTEQEMYYVEVLENNQVITQKQTWTTQFTSVGSFITLRAIKIAD